MQDANHGGGSFAATKRTQPHRGAVAALSALAVLLAGAAAADPAGESGATDALKKLSLDELVNVEVTTVSRHSEPLLHVPSAIQVITSEQIRRSGATTIAEALRLADNLDVARKNAHDWAISARGFNTALANKLLVMIDGRTVYTPLFSGVFWDAQNTLLADVERIEVISGPGGTQWGANAVNGVINIITKHARDTLGGYLEGAAGSSLQDQVGVRYGTQLAPGTFLRVYGEHFNFDDEQLADGASAHDRWHMSQAGFRADTELSPRQALTVQGDVYDGDEDLAGATTENSGWNLLGRWNYRGSDDTGANLQTYLDHTALRDPVPAFSLQGHVLAPAGFLRDELDTFDIDFDYRWRASERQLLQWGLGYRHTHDDVTNAPALAFFPQTLDQNLYSAFVQDEISLTHALSLTLGSKVEHNDYTGLELEPNARLRWDLGADTTLWAAVSRAVRTPSRIDRDLSEPTPSAGLVLLAGSDTFVSETVVAHELGIRSQLAAQVAGSLSLFYNDYDHIRSTSLTPTTILPFFFQNNLHGETYGAELSVDYQAGPGWRLHAGVEPLHEHLRVNAGQFDLNAARNEIADPHDRAVLRSSWDLPHDLELDASLRWTAQREINNGPTIGIVPSYWDADLRLGWRVSPRLDLSLVGQNLLHDRHAEYGFPDATRIEIQRSVYAKAVWRF